MKRLDQWLGLHAFQPLIIAFCRATGVTQFAVYRYAWWLMALWCLYRMNLENWLASSITILFAIGRTVSVGHSPDRPREPTRWVRYVFLVNLALALLLLAVDGHYVGILQTILILFGEYALTIRTIPPRSSKKAKELRRARAAV